MNFKTTIALLVVLAAIGGYLFFTSGKLNTDATTPANDPSKLFTVASADVAKLVITPRDDKPTVLEKAGTDWNLRQPIDWPADTFAVSQLVDDVIGLASRGQVNDASDASAGLDRPRYKIELIDKSGKTQTVLVGNLSTLGSDLYVRRAEEKTVLLAPGGFEEKLDDVAKRVRQAQLIKTSTADIKQLQIEKAGRPSVYLVKTGATWAVTQPFSAPADESAVSDLLAAVTGLRATDYVAEESTDAAKYGLDKPQATITFDTTAPATQPMTTAPTGTSVTIGRYDDVRKQNVFATTSLHQAVARVPVRLLELAEKPAIELRSKEVVKIETMKVGKLAVTIDIPATTQPTTRPADVRDVSVRRRVEDVVLGPTTKPTTGPATTQATTLPVKTVWQVKKTGDAWTDANDGAVDELLRLVNPLKAEKYLASAPVLPTTAAGHFKLTLTTEEAGKSTTYQFTVTEGPTGKPAVVEYDGLVFEVESNLIEKLKAKFE